MKKWYISIALILCMSILCGGCGDSSKEQKIVVYDYIENTEEKFDSDNIAVNELINDISDYLMDKEDVNLEIPKEALKYKKITLFQLLKDTEEILLEIEILKDNGNLYCTAYFKSYPETIYKAELPAEIVKAINSLWG